MSDDIEVDITDTRVKEAPKRGKRIIVRDNKNEVAIMPTVQAAMDDATSIIAKEISLMKRKVARPNMELTREESSKLVKYTKALIELSKEEREQEKHSDLGNLTDEELMELARTSVKQIQDRTKSGD